MKQTYNTGEMLARILKSWQLQYLTEFCVLHLLLNGGQHYLYHISHNLGDKTTVVLGVTGGIVEGK